MLVPFARIPLCGIVSQYDATDPYGVRNMMVAIDALDEQAADKHLQCVIDKAGRVDISFNTVGIPDVGGLKLSVWRQVGRPPLLPLSTPLSSCQ